MLLEKLSRKLTVDFLGFKSLAFKVSFFFIGLKDLVYLKNAVFLKILLPGENNPVFLHDFSQVDERITHPPQCSVDAAVRLVGNFLET